VLLEKNAMVDRAYSSQMNTTPAPLPIQKQNLFAAENLSRNNLEAPAV
jgi:hypothetical protein